MAKFPIEYAKTLPSGRAPAVRADTGAAELGEAYSRMGAAVAGLGENIFGMAMTIQGQQDVADYSELKRKFDEAGFAIYNLATGDIDVDEKSWTDFETKSSTDFQHKRKNVNNMLTRHINEVIPDWKQSFYKHSLGLARKDVHAKFILESENRLSEPTLTNYYVLLDQRKKLKDITQSEYDILLERAPNDSVVQKMRKSIGQGSPQTAIEQAKQMKNATADQMDYRNKLLRMAEQQASINTDEIQNKITFGMFDNRNKTLVEKETLGMQYISELAATPGLSAENARAMTNRIEDWMAGKERPHNSIIYTNLYRNVTQLHRGLGRAEDVRRSVVGNYQNLDDQHFESLNKYLDQTVEGWNADTLRRLEKEAIPHLAPRLSFLEKVMEMSAMPGISAKEKAKYDNLIERLQEPAKIDAHRLAQYNNQCRKWSESNPDAPNLYEAGKRIFGEFEKYTDDQIQEMEKQLESGAILEESETQILPLVTKDSDYDALPSGIVFRTPEGKQWRKP